MSIETTRPFFEEQASLREGVEQFLVAAHELTAQDPNERIDAIERTVAFLAEILLPHAAAEERVLYPQAERLLGEGRAGTAETVAFDRVAVRDLIAALVAADVRDTGHVQELLYALYALLSAHFWREEEVYLKLVSIDRDLAVEQLLERVFAEEREQRSGAHRGRFDRRGGRRRRTETSVRDSARVNR